MRSIINHQQYYWFDEWRWGNGISFVLSDSSVSCGYCWNLKVKVYPASELSEIKNNLYFIINNKLDWEYYYWFVFAWVAWQVDCGNYRFSILKIGFCIAYRFILQRLDWMRHLQFSFDQSLFGWSNPLLQIFSKFKAGLLLITTNLYYDSSSSLGNLFLIYVSCTQVFCHFSCNVIPIKNIRNLQIHP